MILYEVRVGRLEPLVYDNPDDAFREASSFKAHGKRVSVVKKNYLNGSRLGTTHLSVNAYEAILRRLKRQCKGYAYVKATHVRRAAGSVDESEWGDPMVAKGDALAFVAAVLADFTPISDIIIDDYGYAPKFYDVFYVMRVYASNELIGAWDLLYETPQADPKPHVMDV